MNTGKTIIRCQSCRKDITDKISELNRVKAELPEYEYHYRKENILLLLLRFMSSIRIARLAIQTDNGITTEPSQMVDGLRSH
jgi:hypothetical protein